MIFDIFIGNLKKLMKERGIKTQTALANKIGIDRRTVNKWFTGKVKGLPDNEQLQKIYDYFNIYIYDLIQQEPTKIDEKATSYDDKQISNDLADLSEEGRRKVAEYIRDLKTVEKVRKLQEGERFRQCSTDQPKERPKKIKRKTNVS